jgi:uncharacterized protein with LGFP repeats
MAEPVSLIDYHFGTGAIANPDGSAPATATNVTTVPGPGMTPLGPRPRARAFHGNSRLQGSVTPTDVDTSRFTVRLVMRATAPVTDRANVFEAEMPACSLHLLAGSGSADFRVKVTVDNGRNGWAGIDSALRRSLQVGTWYTIDLVYDIDTLALLIDGALVGVTAFPVGAAAARTSAGFVMGVHPDLVRWPFKGDVAALQLFAGIPEAIEAVLDDARGSNEWRLRLKENTLLPTFALGTRRGDITYDAVTSSSQQRFDNVTIVAATGYPDAFEMGGVIRDRYDRGRLGAALGPLLSDEENARANGSRRNVFERGAIYWSSATGAWEVYGLIYLTYERLGGSVSVLGLPVGPPDNILGGRLQVFERGIIYLKDGASRAFEVHGAILQRYVAMGGPGVWGFPVSDEEDVLLAGDVMLAPPPTGSRRSRFERCTFYWSAATGAHEVHGAIRDAYEATGGAGLPHDTRFNGLGLPTSDESDWPAWAGGGRFNTFEHGSVVYNGSATVACPDFQLYLGLVQTEENEGFTQGQNDLYFNIRVKRNGAEIYSRRVPDDDAFDGDNSHDLDMTLDPVITPNDPEMRITLEVEVWDEDGGFGGGDDHLGTFTTELNIANGWGLLIRADGLFSSSVDDVQRIDWQVRPRQLPDAPRDFWTLTNRATSNIIYPQYAAAFSDIDDDPEWTDPDDWAEREFFARTIKGAASGGNCFGMVNTALHAWHGSDFGLPLARFNDWEAVRNQINIRQVAYFGSDVMSQVSDQTDRGISPTQVFTETRQRNAAGEISVINIWSANDYTGSGHSVLPVAWDDSSFPWTITVFDPNGGLAQTTITIDQYHDTFAFNNAGLSFSGSMHYSPWGTIDHRQSSPVWDPTLLLFVLFLIAVGADAETTGITDAVGDNLRLADNPALDLPRRQVFNRTFAAQSDPQFAGQFSSIVPPDGRLNGELLVRRVRAAVRNGVTTRIGPVLDMTLREALAAMQPVPSHPGAADRVALNPQPLPPRLANELLYADLPPSLLARRLRDLLHDLPHPQATGQMETRALTAVNNLSDWLRRQSSMRGPDYVHHLRGLRRGRLDYRTRFRLAQTRFQSAIDGGEQNVLRLEGLDGRMPLHRLTVGRDKAMAVEQTVRLGRGAGFARIRLDSIPVRAGLELKVSMRAGLSVVDVITAGDRVDVPVRIETWRANQPVASRRVQHFTVPMEGGLRLSPQLLDPTGGLKAARIETLFGEAQNSVVLT